jgi:hypothetical protein
MNRDQSLLLKEEKSYREKNNKILSIKLRIKTKKLSCLNKLEI